MKGWLDETAEALGMKGGFDADGALFILKLLIAIALGWIMLALLQ